MNFIRSGFKNIVGGDASSAVDGTDILEAISRLVNRLLTASLPDDRRDALRALRSLSRTYWLEVGMHAMSALVRCLRTTAAQPSYNQEVDTLCLALETLKNIFAGAEESDGQSSTKESRHQKEEELDRLTMLFLDQSDSVTILLKLIDSAEFPVRMQSVRLLTALLTRKPKAVQEIVLENHASIPKVVDLLQDVQEVIRNDAVLLLCELTDSNASIQKIVAFHSGFERLLNIISDEATSVIAEDCLYLMLQLLDGNPSNVQLFKENSLIQYLRELLALFQRPELPESAANSRDDQWPPQMSANVNQLMSIVRALVKPSNSGELLASCQKAILDCGLLYELCTLLLSASITADVLSNVIICVAEVVRGSQANQDFLETVVAPSIPPRPVVLILLMSMTNRGQVFALRLAALYCVQCYLYKNERGKHSIIQTLLPSSTDVREVTAGQLICSGLVSNDPTLVWLCSCALCHCLYGASAEQERLLRVQLAKAVGEPALTLLEQVTTCLQRSGDFQIRMALLMLLSAWLAHCPLAVGEFLQTDKTLSYLLGMVRSEEVDDSENLLKGMSAFLLGICVLYNDDNVSSRKKGKHCSRQTVLDVIHSQLGPERYVERLEGIARSEAFASAARKPLPRASRPEDLVFDHEFTKLFRSLETSVCRYVAGNAVLTNGLPAGQADMHDRIVDEYKQLIKQQDDENGRLRTKVEELTKTTEMQKQRLNDLEQLCSTKISQQQLDTLAQLEAVKSHLASTQSLLQQRQADLKCCQQNCLAWQTYVQSQFGVGDVDVVYQQQIQQLNAQLDNGWNYYEQQSAELARLVGENAKLKASLDEAQCSLKLCQLRLSESKSGAPNEQVCGADYSALAKEHELLLELLSDQDQKIKELRQRLANCGVQLSSDDDDDDDDDNEEEEEDQPGPSANATMSNAAVAATNSIC